MFQWYLFVILAAAGIFAALAQQTYTVEVCGRQETRWGWIPVLLILIPLIVLATTRRATFGDTYPYIKMFENPPDSLDAIPGSIFSQGKDRGFTVFSILVKTLLTKNVRVFFALVASICLFCVAGVYKKHSCQFVASMFLFIASGEYLQWTHNSMRQFIAVAVIFAATDLLLQKKYLQYYAVVLLMSTIHGSALVMIPVTLVIQGRAWNLRTVLFTLAVLIAINFSDDLRSLIAGFMEDTQYEAEVSQFLETEGTNLFRVLVYCIPPVMALLFKQHLDYAQDPLLDLATNMSIISMGVYIISAVTSGIFIGRIPIYFSLYNYLLLPWLLENVFEVRSKRLVYGIIILCYLAFYYYQVSVAWSI